MDLATDIVDTAALAFKEECEEKKCEIVITLRGRYTYIIYITPMNKHVLIKYKTLEYKIAKDNKEDYDTTVDFLQLAIIDDVEMSIKDEIEYSNYCPDHDDEFKTNILSIKRRDTKLFYMHFNFECFGDILKTYLKTLRNMI